MGFDHLVVKQFRRLSPSRFTAMRDCLLREVWSSSGNESLLVPSPIAELGSVIHHLLEAAGLGQLGSEDDRKVDSLWNELITQAEKRMALSTLMKHLVPLSRSIPDFEVRKRRAYRRAGEIAHNVTRIHSGGPKQTSDSACFELWVESNDGRVGGYIDRVSETKDGAVLSDYKSGAVLDAGTGDGIGNLKRAYKEQLKLYAALYQIKSGIWPARLEIVPLQGSPVEVAFKPKEAEHLLSEACTFLHAANKRIEAIENGSAEIAGLASPQAQHCRFCLFRPACQTYWAARTEEPQEHWPNDLRGLLVEKIQLRNGKMCIKIEENSLSTPNCVTVRNLNGATGRYPALNYMGTGSRMAIYGLKYHYHTGDYVETQNTVVYGVD